MKMEVFINLLMAVKGGRKPGNGRQLIGFVESTFAFFEIFQSDSFHIHRMPMNLTRPVMSMTMECRNDTPQT
jgi:hypothetical protein